MDEDPSQLAAKVATSLGHFVNLMGYIASPRLVAKAQEMPSREHLLEHVDEYLAVLEHVKSSTGEHTMITAEPHARRAHGEALGARRGARRSAVSAHRAASSPTTAATAPREISN